MSFGINIWANHIGPYVARFQDMFGGDMPGSTDGGMDPVGVFREEKKRHARRHRPVVKALRATFITPVRFCVVAPVKYLAPPVVRGVGWTAMAPVKGARRLLRRRRRSASLSD
ncbi:hypothetical protein CYMTET_12086 [Cymbomonas tetramitiformis]|uniref:Uncharacterized protein n=1 Tax=Cymbomonas tetramitiformis TaxID=36881 RepID=A0AAE0GLB8_9CHLO|nr:hypothetical protein CYMTET_12086 [Cymbomonas tetramitiformis]